LVRAPLEELDAGAEAEPDAEPEAEPEPEAAAEPDAAAEPEEAGAVALADADPAEAEPVGVAVRVTPCRGMLVRMTR
jgi:hypothetical protein